MASQNAELELVKDLLMRGGPAELSPTALPFDALACLASEAREFAREGRYDLLVVAATIAKGRLPNSAVELHGWVAAYAEAVTAEHQRRDSIP